MTSSMPLAQAPGTIRVNGAARPLEAGGLIAVLRGLRIDPKAPGVAIAVNGAVVRRANWAETPLNEGDAVEIVRLFAGG